MGITACLDQVCLGMTFYVLPKRSIYCRLRVIVWNLVKFLVTLLLFRTVLVFAQSRKIIEVCFFFFFGVLRWVFIFLNKCPMTVISYHTAPSHIDHLEWSGYPITPRLSHQLWSASPSTPYQQDKKKTPQCARVKTQRSVSTIMMDTFYHSTKRSVDKSTKQKWEPKSNSNPCTPHIVNVIMDVWTGSWELLACMIYNRSIWSLKSSVVVLVGCLARMPWGLEAVMVYVVSRSDVSGSS